MTMLNPSRYGQAHGPTKRLRRPFLSTHAFALSRQFRWFVHLFVSVLTLANNSLASEFIPLGILPGGDRSWARGVSDDGSVVVGFSGSEAFRWTDVTGMVGLGSLPGYDESSAGYAPGSDGVSGDGSVVVGRSTKRTDLVTTIEAFIYTEAEGMRSLGQHDSNARAASYDGGVVVGATIGNGRHEAFRWTETEGIVGLGSLLDDSIASDVSADGSVIVGHNVDNDTFEYDVFRWTKETGMHGLGIDGRDPSVSADGTVIAVSRSSSSRVEGLRYAEAFRWTESTGAIGLGSLPETANADGISPAAPRDINGDGSIIIGWSGFRDERQGFVWSEQYGMESLKQVLTDRYGLGWSLDGWQLRSPQDISANGRFIAGIGVNPDGADEAWLVRLDSALVPYSDVLGDFDFDGDLTVNDINRLTEAIQQRSTDSLFDMNGDDVVSFADREFWVGDLAQTFFGDANLDQEVNFSDFLALSDGFGKPGAWAQGDSSGDGTVAFEDFLLLSDNFGKTVVVDQAAVPEPSGFGLLAIGVLAIVNFQRERKAT